MPNVKFTVEVLIPGKEEIGKLFFYRESSPRTFILIWQTLRKPITARLIVKKSGEIDIPLKIGRIGPEKSLRDIRRGEIAYWPQSQLLMMFLKDQRTFNPVNLAGEIDNLSFFDSLERGVTAKLQMVESPIDDKYYL